MTDQNQVILYQTEDGTPQLEVRLQEETVWLNQAQMTSLFERDQSVISRHINNIFKEQELDKESNMHFLHIANSDKPVAFYSLDVIISVGYRVKSRRGTQFRIWANKILKNYLVQGYAINEKRLQEKAQQLEELKRVVHLQERVISQYALENDEAKGLVNVIVEYTSALDFLDDYDHQRLEIPETGSPEVYQITYEEARQAISELGRQTNFAGLFGQEKDDSFKGSLENIYQTFDGIDLYPTLEEKAAHLLYFVVKNHSFTDGNKRIAAFLFVWFMERNNILFHADGSKRLPDNTLVALTLMIAESQPDDKDMMIKVIVNLINQAD